MQVAMSGARLAYVVVEQEGVVRRPVHKMMKGGGGIKVVDVEEPAGFLVYFPRGHVLRIKSQKELAQYNLDKAPRIVNLSGLNDPNSAIGRMMMSDDQVIRREGMADLEKYVIRLAEAKTGRITLTRDVADLEVEAA